ncbi:hypothetical protein [Sulfuriflexus mobilis]|uniref:hypothetical protein n=1 Tax=Sulfuriflexus mobilis TaxID=1811807 RepID=UPI000F84053E|nr:hypothetical protein [Sulfuriflexus mobilis]
MKLSLKYFACLSMLLFTPVTTFANSGWTNHVQVTELTPTTHERFLVTLNVTKNPSGCKNKEIFYQDYSSSGSEKMFHTLLEAVVSGKKVRVFVTGKCELNGYSEISSVGITL